MLLRFDRGFGRGYCLYSIRTKDSRLGALLQKFYWKRKVIAPFDVFQLCKAGDPLWLAEAHSLSDALAFIRTKGSGKYLVYSQRTGHKNLYEVTADGQAVLTQQPES